MLIDSLQTSTIVTIMAAAFAIVSFGCIFLFFRRIGKLKTRLKSQQARADAHQHNEERFQALIATYEQEKDRLLKQQNLSDKLLTLARATSGTSTLKQTLKNTLYVASMLTEAEIGSLLLLDGAGRVVESFSSAEGRDTKEVQNIVGQVMDKGLAGWVARTGETTLISDTSKDERWIVIPDSPYQAGSVLGVPILRGETVVGILTLLHTQTHHFNDEDVHLMQSAADQMGLALSNAQIFEGQRRILERQTAVYELLKAISKHLNPGAVAHAAVQTAVQLTGWSMAAIMIPDTKREQLIAQASAGYLAPSWGRTTPITEDNMMGRVFKTAETQHISDVEQVSNYIPPHPDIQSALILPMRRGREVFGVLTIGQDEPQAFAPEDVLLAEAMAEATALALANAELHTTLSNQTAELRALYTVMRSVNESLVQDEMLTETLNAVITELKYDAGLIMLADPVTDELAYTTTQGLSEEILAFSHKHQFQTPCDYVHGQQQSLIIHNVNDTSAPTLKKLRQTRPQLVEYLQELAQTWGFKAYSGIPLQHKNQSLGVMSLFRQRPIDPIDETLPIDLNLQTGIAQQVAAAVANARLFQAVSDERGRLEAVLENSQGGIVLIGKGQRILVINQPALSLLGIKGEPKEWEGRHISELAERIEAYAPEAAESIREVRARVQEGNGHTFEGEYEIPPATLGWSNVPVMVEAQQIGRMLILRDVTEERLLEQMREDLTRTMVHDLRNPLHMISSGLGLLQTVLQEDYDIGADEKRMLSISMANAEKMLTLVNAILEISHLESRRLPIGYKLFNLEALVRDVFRALEPMAQEKQIELRHQLVPSANLVWADEGLIERVLTNLVGNALKFSPQSSSLCVTAERVPENHHVLVHVIDTGPGIPTELRSRLFEKFARGNQQGRGSGLGLAFCKMALEAHGEKIWVEKSSEEGTTFAFTLPLPPEE